MQRAKSVPDSIANKNGIKGTEKQTTAMKAIASIQKFEDGSKEGDEALI